MMNVDLFHFGSEVLNFFAQSEVAYALPVCPDDERPWEMYGSSFHAITAAWATLGYYAQSDVLHYLHDGWQKFGILMYLCAGIAGLYMMGMGQPPKNWVWFFIGPAVFYFLIDTPAYVHGVGWMIGPYRQNQSEVWKLAEAGAVNLGVVRRGNIRFDKFEGPSQRVEVSQPFVVFDSLLSDTIRQLSTWTGALTQTNPYALSGGVDTRRTSVSLLSTAADTHFGEVIDTQESCMGDQVHFSALTNSKWTYLNSITQAELANSEAKDAFARFIASECGERLTAAINFSSFAKASNLRKGMPPDTVFKVDSSVADSRYYQVLKGELATMSVPTPNSLKNLLKDDLSNNSVIPMPGTQPNRNSFIRAIDWSPVPAANQCGLPKVGGVDTYPLEQVVESDTINCSTFLYLLILYFRYEAGVLLSQAFQEGAPTDWYPEDVTYNIFYGWDIPYNEGGASCPVYNRGLTWQGQLHFAYNLILAHLFRNEMNRLPEIVSVSKNKTEAIQKDSQLFNATIGSTSKAAEVFTWSLMIPYVQGILLYMLTLAFPIVAMLMLVPSWSKMIFTWMSFFVWVKLWDLGFAFVSSLERSLWAMMANSNSSREINKKVLEMATYGGVNEIGCDFSSLADCPAGAVPTVIVTQGPGACPMGGQFGSCLNVFASNATPGTPGINDSAIDAAYRIFDLGLVVGASLNFDLAAGYYIYIMSALYFAVPAVTGQMVLGAKAGMASMVDKVAGDPAGKAASAAQSSFTSNEISALKQSGASLSQESTAKGYRSSGLIHKALDQQNQAALHGLEGAHAGQVEGGYRRLDNSNALTTQTDRGYRQFAGSMLNAAWGQSSKSDYIRTSSEKAAAQQGKAAAEPTPQAQGPLNNPTSGGAGRTGSSQTGSNLTGAKNEASPGNDPQPMAGGSTTAQGKDGPQPVDSAYQARVAMSQTPLKQVQGGGWVGGLMSGAKRAGGFIAELDVNAAENVAQSGNEAYRSALQNKRSNDFTALGGQAGIKGHYHGQASSGYRSASDRTMALANFSAASANYDTMNKFAQSRAGRFAVLGAPPGMFAPDKRPEDAMGMAMSGMLNSPGRATRQIANFFDPQSGAFQQAVRNSNSELTNQFGYQAVTSAYKPSTPIQELARSYENTAGMIRDMATTMKIPEVPPAEQRSGNAEPGGKKS